MWNKKLACIGCTEGHDTIEEVIACETADQERERRAADEAAAKLPKKDGRFLARNRPSPARRKR